MCLILFSFDPHSERPLTILANRDEFYGRNANQAGFWSDKPEILAGRDLVAGGTWLGINTSGRFAAVTNFREPSRFIPDARSRGELPTDFLSSSESILEYLSRVQEHSTEYNGFNLLVYDSQEMGYYSNRSGERPRTLETGVYGLSNGLLDTPWPKVTKGKQALSSAITAGVTEEQLLDILADDHVAADADLPDTGVGIEKERMLSALCIVSPEYGTRCSTLVRFSSDGGISLTEKTIVPPDLAHQTISFQVSVRDASHWNADHSDADQKKADQST